MSCPNPLGAGRAAVEYALACTRLGVDIEYVFQGGSPVPLRARRGKKTKDIADVLSSDEEQSNLTFTIATQTGFLPDPEACIEDRIIFNGKNYDVTRIEGDEYDAVYEVQTVRKQTRRHK